VVYGVLGLCEKSVGCKGRVCVVQGGVWEVLKDVSLTLT
jgi:hypothetical protein